MVVSLNYCSQNGGNLNRAPYYNGNPNIGPRIIRNLDQYPYGLGFRGLGFRVVSITELNNVVEVSKVSIPYMGTLDSWGPRP